ncbi:hypothetical protein [Pseudarthrobacter sp. YAF2]|uniref:hypothetical protein n=1 Tax=Pseudarthrobacter sp. YAF2 TaxID=3233078 RepID=UPI003F9689A2
MLFLHLEGSADTLGARMAARNHEFMPASLLASQLAALEPLGADEAHVLLDVGRSPDQLAASAATAVRAGTAKPVTTPAGE